MLLEAMVEDRPPDGMRRARPGAHDDKAIGMVARVVSDEGPRRNRDRGPLQGNRLKRGGIPARALP